MADECFAQWSIVVSTKRTASGGRTMAANARSDFPDVLADGLRILVDEQGTTTTIALEGEWDLAEQRAVRRAVREALAGQPECLVLDLRRLSFIDSSGVHAAIELAQHSTGLGVRLVIIPGPRAVQRVFELCQLIDMLPFATSTSA
jgi:anti-anti-sigma factor